MSAPLTPVPPQFTPAQAERARALGLDLTAFNPDNLLKILDEVQHWIDLARKVLELMKGVDRG